MLEVPLAAETKKKKPIIPDIPNIAANGSKVKENIEFIKLRKIIVSESNLFNYC